MNPPGGRLRKLNIGQVVGRVGLDPSPVAQQPEANGELSTACALSLAALFLLKGKAEA